MVPGDDHYLQVVQLFDAPAREAFCPPKRKIMKPCVNDSTYNVVVAHHSFTKLLVHFNTKGRISARCRMRWFFIGTLLELYKFQTVT